MANQTIGSIIDEMSAIREQRREIASKDSELKGQYDELESQLLELMDDQEMNSSTGKKARATVSEQTLPVIDDWDAFTQYIAENEYYQLFQRRIAAGAFEELLNAGEEIPGARSIKKTKVNLRNL